MEKIPQESRAQKCPIDGKGALSDHERKHVEVGLVYTPSDPY